MKSVFYFGILFLMSYANQSHASAAEINKEKQTATAASAKQSDPKAAQGSSKTAKQSRTILVATRKINAIVMPQSIKDIIIARDREALKSLLAKNPEYLHSRDEHKNTPLIWTQLQTSKDWLDRTLITNTLLDFGADRNAVNAKGMDSFMIAYQFYRIKK